MPTFELHYLQERGFEDDGGAQVLVSTWSGAKVLGAKGELQERIALTPWAVTSREFNSYVDDLIKELNDLKQKADNAFRRDAFERGSDPV